MPHVACRLAKTCVTLFSLRAPCERKGGVGDEERQVKVQWEIQATGGLTMRFHGMPRPVVKVAYFSCRKHQAESENAQQPFHPGRVHS